MKMTIISDTHTKHALWGKEVFTEGDVIVHGGDISVRGELYELYSFLAWFDTLPFKKKIFIAGNHDWCFERKEDRAKINEALSHYPDIIYLENDSVVIDGVKFYGSPITPEFHGWAFNRKRGSEIAMEWERIPHDVDVLITHGPLLNFGDVTIRGNTHAGCADLLKKVEEIQPTLHICGHIHEGRGMYSVGKTTSINASMLDVKYQPVDDLFNIDYNNFLIDYHEEKSESREDAGAAPPLPLQGD